MNDSILLKDPRGQIEGVCHIAQGEAPPLALILHPHPKFGGTMDNPVVKAMFETCVERNFSTLRINFQGVGRSRGVHEEGAMNELLDATMALDWLQSIHPASKHCWVMGFSFGAYVAMQVLMRRPEIFGFVSVAPLCGLYDFSFLAPCPASGLFVAGKQDKLTPEDNLVRLVHHLRQQNNAKIKLSMIPGADHYFTKHLPQLRQTIGVYLDMRMEEAQAEEEEVGRR